MWWGVVRDFCVVSIRMWIVRLLELCYWYCCCSSSIFISLLFPVIFLVWISLPFEPPILHLPAGKGRGYRGVITGHGVFHWEHCYTFISPLGWTSHCNLLFSFLFELLSTHTGNYKEKWDFSSWCMLKWKKKLLNLQEKTATLFFLPYRKTTLWPSKCKLVTTKWNSLQWFLLKFLHPFTGSFHPVVSGPWMRDAPAIHD